MERSFSHAILAEWVSKAEADYATAGRAYRARTFPNYDASCFHSQQCIEKYMKAYMLRLDLPLPCLRNLPAILSSIEKAHPIGVPLSDPYSLALLATDYRYPGESADKPEAKAALKLATYYREQLREALGLPK